MEREKLQLVPFTINVKEELFQLTDKNRSFLRQWLDWVDNVKTSQDTLEFLQGQIASNLLGYTIHHDGRVVGTVGEVRVLEDSCVEIGYWLDQDMQGRGVVTWAVKELLHEIVKGGKYKSISIRCVSQNVGSQRVALKCGFELQGTVKDGFVLNGVAYDLLLYRLYTDEKFC